MKTKIISAFPGTGKTYYHNNHKDTTLDSDSSQFSWIINSDGNKIRNPNFLEDYMKHINDNLGKYEYIFVSSHSDVYNRLYEENLSFTLVIPEYDLKEKYLEKYKIRGNNQAFIDLIDKNWYNWLKDIRDFWWCTQWRHQSDIVILQDKQTISDYLK